MSQSIQPTGSWRLPPTVVPGGISRPLWVRDGVITDREIPSAAELPGAFSSPGLVDCHIHVALGVDNRPLNSEEAREILRAARDRGELLVRDMGAPASLTLELPPDPELPQLIASGRQLAVEGGFLPGCHEPVPPEALIDAALMEIDRGATWVKVLVDWADETLTYPLDLLQRLVQVAHSRGVRVAAHSQWRGVREVVRVGVDSIEHGDLIDEPTLRYMSDHGIAWVPTTNQAVKYIELQTALLDRDDLEPDRRRRLERLVEINRSHLANLEAMIPTAFQLGVPVFPSTDRIGTVADEVVRFVEFGVDPADALRAATTAARAFLGVPGLEVGAPADVVTYERNPDADPAALRRPAAILLRGRRIA
jgi:imidazolonepropionase-like amidohydrolase